MNWTLRPFCASDRTAILRLIVVLQDYERSISRTRLPGRFIAARYYRFLMRGVKKNRGRLLVARAGRAIVGYVCMWLYRERGEIITAPVTVAYVTDIVVVPKHRRLGIGLAMLRAADDFARERGVREVRIGVLAGNSVARRTYEAAGFRDFEVLLAKRLR